MSRGADAIVRERQRQVAEEHWSADHDDGHRYGDLAVRAAELAVAHTDATVCDAVFDDEDAWGLLAKHTDTIRRLEIAGALIAAEIDRLHRVADPDGGAR